MKKILIITGCMAMAVVLLVSCDRTRRSPGHAYMPDMAYSQAYETYAPADERLAASGAHYTAQPVAGTMARGDMEPYKLENDTSGYNRSGSIKNPLDTASIDMGESERLYLVNCGICHGTKLDGNGPLYNGGNGPYPVAPKNLVGDNTLSEGKVFYVATYGKGQMGSYASQLTSRQRWMVAAYVMSKHPAGGGAQAAVKDSTGATAAKTDSATAKSK